jgi:hypothetical protein
MRAELLCFFFCFASGFRFQSSPWAFSSFRFDFFFFLSFFLHSFPFPHRPVLCVVVSDGLRWLGTGGGVWADPMVVMVNLGEVVSIVCRLELGMAEAWYEHGFGMVK